MDFDRVTLANSPLSGARMKQRERSAGFEAVLIALWFAIGAFGCGPIRSVEPDPPERIILIVVDTLRRDHVSVYGPRVSTPQIDALAKRGQVFSDLTAAYHQTTMSMAGLFTGHTPSLEKGEGRERLDWMGETWCGLWRFRRSSGSDSCLPESLPTLAERLRGAGYWTLGVTSNELLYRPGGYERGFDRWVELAGTPVPAGRVNQAVLTSLTRRPSDRFFLYVHYMDVHDYRAQGRTYAESVAVADQAVGRLVSILEEADLMQGSVVIFTADHGEHLPLEEHFVEPGVGHTGRPSFETLTRVPLIVAPAMFPDETKPLRGIDLHGMILQLAGIQAPDAEVLDPDEIFLSERHFQTYRRGEWKSLRHRDTGKHFLVNLRRDPDERRTVHRQNGDIVAQHAERMDQIAEALGSPDYEGRTISDSDRARLQALGYLPDD